MPTCDIDNERQFNCLSFINNKYVKRILCDLENSYGPLKYLRNILTCIIFYIIYKNV